MRKIRLALLLAGSTILGQLDRGSIVGTVADPTGAVIPTVKIYVTQKPTGAKYETVSNENGQYAVPNLPVGPYVISFEAPSFKKLDRSGITLKATEVLRVDGSLEVGSTAEPVQVNASVARIQTDSPEMGTTVDNKQMVDLPFNFSGGR